MKFNFSIKKKQPTVNHEGAVAWRLSPETELYAAVVTAGLSDNFYEKGETRLARIRQLIAKNEPEFVAKLAVYARKEMYLRSVPLVLAVELARTFPGERLVSRTVAAVVQRADEITELLACYQVANGRTGTKKLNRLSRQVQKGLAEAFTRFDEYQFAKYNRAAEIRLRDALFLVHPRPRNEAQQRIFDKIAANALEVPYTWETRLSETGQQQYASAAEREAATRAVWEELAASGRLGYMALLRNLRNMLEARVSADTVTRICATLSDPQAVAAAKQLPFRFLAAYRELRSVYNEQTPAVLDALEHAISASAANLQGFDDQTSVLLACDVSGSMLAPISPNSKVRMYDIGLVLAMLLQSKCRRVVTGMFGERWKVVNLPQGNILANVDALHKREGEVGYATNGHLVIEDLISLRMVMDRVMIFTDCQLWDSRNGGANLAAAWQRYKKIAPKARLYLFDLAGHGTVPVNMINGDVFMIAGWSDKIFGVLEALERGGEALEKVKHTVL
jgi:hypothetical protein